MTHTHVLAMRFSSQGTSTGRQLVIPSETSSDDNPIVETKLREFSKGNLLQNDGLDSLNLLTDGSPFYMRTLPKKRYKKMLGNAMIINWSLWWCDCMRFLFDIHAKDPVDLSEGIPTKLIDLVECKCVQLFQDRLKNLCKIIPQYPVLPTCHTNRKLKMLNRRSDWHILTFKYYQIWPQHFWDQSDTKASSDMLWQQQPSSHVVLGRA